jgi:hypothetical protein
MHAQALTSICASAVHVTHMCVHSVDGFEVGTIVNMDYAGDNGTFYLDDDDCGPFSVLSMNMTGAVFVNTSKGSLDFETTNAYTCSVSFVEDGVVRGLPTSTSLNVTIWVVDVNEPPSFVFIPAGYRINEEACGVLSGNPLDGFISVHDPDAGNDSALIVSTASYSGSYGDSFFEVVDNISMLECRGGRACVLSMRSGCPRIDYDAGVVDINVTLTVSDDRNASSSYSFVVIVDGINEGMLKPSAQSKLSESVTSEHTACLDP